MVLPIQRDIIYTLPKKGYSRTYPVEFTDPDLKPVFVKASSKQSGAIFLAPNTYAEIKVLSYLSEGNLLLEVSKFDFYGHQTACFQALMDKDDFRRMIDPDYAI